jgi:hypothetical protein
LTTIPAPGRTAQGHAARPRTLAAGAAVVAAAALAIESMVGATFDVDDHAAGAGRASEALVAVAFLSGAVALAAFASSTARTSALARALCLPAVCGVGGIGVATLAVTATGREWPESAVTVIVLVAVIGLVVQAVVSTRTGAWPWWTGVLLASTLPVMFVVPNPYNSLVMAACWSGAAVAAWRH